jgi:hypothetical protein
MYFVYVYHLFPLLFSFVPLFPPYSLSASLNVEQNFQISAAKLYKLKSISGELIKAA